MLGSKIIEKELSYILTGLFFRIQKNRGRFCTEKQYCDDFENELKKENIPYHREKDIKSLDSNSPIGNRCDFIISNKIIIDFKAKAYITKDDYNQMQRYLNALNLELGIIVNMRNYNIRPKRVLNSNFNPNSDHLDNDSGN